jgi:Fe2+ transport system protein FeoA
VDERGVIVAIRQEDKLKNLGLDCGVEFSVIDKSGDTIIISFSGNELSLSKEVAGLILVKKSQDEFSE